MRRPILNVPPHLCPEGFDPVWEYLEATGAPADVRAAWRHAQVGAVRLRACVAELRRVVIASGDGGPMKIDHAALADHARRLVLEAANVAGLDGEAKRKQAARSLAKWADDRVNPKGAIGRIVDAIDGPIWLALAEGMIELAYRGLRAEGAL
jgi:hypothetical protein